DRPTASATRALRRGARYDLREMGGSSRAVFLRDLPTVGVGRSPDLVGRCWRRSRACRAGDNRESRDRPWRLRLLRSSPPATEVASPRGTLPNAGPSRALPTASYRIPRPRWKQAGADTDFRRTREPPRQSLDEIDPAEPDRWRWFSPDDGRDDAGTQTAPAESVSPSCTAHES